MNFLGHLYFSNNDIELMQANLFGDFVKGKDYTHLPLKIQEGVTLHRKIDNYIDNHPAVLDLIRLLYEPMPKVAGIAVDLFFDHLLAKNWNQFHHQEIDEFIYQFYNSINTSTLHYSEHFQFMLVKMQEDNWLLSYKNLNGLNLSCQGVSSRISFENNLKNGVQVFQKYELEIEKSFFEYMNDAILFFSKDKYLKP
jgi:acyl carrier protein phosphodiesterase